MNNQQKNISQNPLWPEKSYKPADVTSQEVEPVAEPPRFRPYEVYVNIPLNQAHTGRIAEKFCRDIISEEQTTFYNVYADWREATESEARAYWVGMVVVIEQLRVKLRDELELMTGCDVGVNVDILADEQGGHPLYEPALLLKDAEARERDGRRWARLQGDFWGRVYVFGPPVKDAH